MLAVVTAADIADIQKPWPARMPSPVPGTAVRHGVRHTLPREKVRHAGEVVAAVVAESRAIAEDARDLVEVEYEPLPVVATAAAALAPGAPLVYEELGDNVAAHIVQRVGDPERAFAAADHTLRETFRVMRGGSHSMEGRGVRRPLRRGARRVHRLGRHPGARTRSARCSPTCSSCPSTGCA